MYKKLILLILLSLSPFQVLSGPLVKSGIDEFKNKIDTASFPWKLVHRNRQRATGYCEVSILESKGKYGPNYTISIKIKESEEGQYTEELTAEFKSSDRLIINEKTLSSYSYEQDLATDEWGRISGRNFLRYFFSEKWSEYFYLSTKSGDSAHCQHFFAE